jgi:hypothetical protein
MAKNNPNFYLLQEDSGEIIGIVGTATALNNELKPLYAENELPALTA